MSTTMRSSPWPDELRTVRAVVHRALDHDGVLVGVLPRVDAEAHPVARRRGSNSSTSKACSDDVRAPVSSFALIHGTSASGQAHPLAPSRDGV